MIEEEKKLYSGVARKVVKPSLEFIHETVGEHLPEFAKAMMTQFREMSHNSPKLLIQIKNYEQSFKEKVKGKEAEILTTLDSKFDPADEWEIDGKNVKYLQDLLFEVYWKPAIEESNIMISKIIREENKQKVRVIIDYLEDLLTDQ